MKTAPVKKDNRSAKRIKKTGAPAKNASKRKIDEDVCVLAEPIVRDDLCCCVKTCC